MATQGVGIKKCILKHKNNKRANKFSSDIKIVQFNIPRLCDKFRKKRYEIEICYRIKPDNKLHRMTIAFGDINVPEYIS